MPWIQFQSYHSVRILQAWFLRKTCGIEPNFGIEPHDDRPTLSGRTKINYFCDNSRGHSSTVFLPPRLSTYLIRNTLTQQFASTPLTTVMCNSLCATKRDLELHLAHHAL